MTAFFGCSSSSTVNPGGTQPQDKGVDPGAGQGTEPGAGTETNPYGVAYPTQNQGYKARNGNTPGNIIKNYKFLGYRNGDKSKLETISLADYFDPEMRQYKLIRFSAAALWCGPCNQETDATVPLAPRYLAEKKVVFIQALTDGPTQGKGATIADLQRWQQGGGGLHKNPINFTVFLDPDVKNLGQFFDAAAIPWNANIDARSMEILTAGVGYSADSLTNEIDQWLQWIDANPAQGAK
jgi:hypothetical protein